MRKITAHIDGMQCGMCESHVNDLVRKNFKVKKVKSSHRTGECTIIAEEDIPRPELQKKLGDMGYRLLDMESEEYRKKGLFRYSSGISRASGPCDRPSALGDASGSGVEKFP